MPIKITNKFIFLSVLIFGSYLCFIGGYGSDEDTLPMIGTFIGFLNGNFMTSRFTGYPVAEFIIGFTSYHFGSYLINLIIFFSFVIGASIFYACFSKKFNINDLIFFLLILISNPVLFFENLEPMDYSLAFLFFSFGYYFLIRNRFEISIVFFGICIGSRINFAPLILVAILFCDSSFLKNEYKKLTLTVSSLFIGCLFYLPVWINSELGFDWLRAGRPEGNILEYLSRVIYKLIISFGLIQFILIVFFIKNILKNKKIKKQSKQLLFLILTNLIIFFYVPAELSYLQPLIIFTYFLVYKSLEKKYLYFLIVLNFLTWFINYDFLKINYKYDYVCDPKQAVSASLNISLKRGHFFDFIESRNDIKCWIDVDSEYGKKVIQGKALK